MTRSFNSAPAIHEHLAFWGLRRYESDDEYFRRQRETIPAADLAELNRLIEARRSDPAADRAFYDTSSQPALLPILHSQRYEYYERVGTLVAQRLADLPSGLVLDFGCGPGILASFYARCCPHLRLVGVDRSPVSVETARARAAELKSANLRFEVGDCPDALPAGPFDVILSTHALVQAEQEPGLPSRDWRTFERDRDAAAQAAFERRIGLAGRLDALCRLLAPGGRLILFEKTRPLARRVPFQRALAARGLSLLAPPQPVRYRLVEEVVEDGPLYVLGRGEGEAPAGRVDWDEAPEAVPGDDLYVCRGEAALVVLSRLPGRTVRGELTRRAGEGALRAEWGGWGGAFAYLSVTGEGGVSLLLVGGEKRGTIARAVEVATGDEGALAALTQGLGQGGEAGSEPPPEQAPLYECHAAVAQAVREGLPSVRLRDEATIEGPDGRPVHVELGEAGALAFVYLADTMDERRLVVVEGSRRAELGAYYGELTSGAAPGGPGGG